jgi:hypothetical protein
VAISGLYIQSTIANQGENFKYNEMLIKKRLDTYDKISGDLNRIYCFIEDVGSWKEENPAKVIAYRRSIHNVMYSSRAIWSPELFSAYLDYMDKVAFRTWNGVGADAAINTTDTDKKKIPQWTNDWSSQITNIKDAHHKETYLRLQILFSNEFRTKKDEVENPLPEKGLGPPASRD